MAVNTDEIIRENERRNKDRKEEEDSPEDDLDETGEGEE